MSLLRLPVANRCHGCGCDLGNLELGSLVPCFACVRLYQAAPHGLERVLIGSLEPALRRLVDELLHDHSWQSHPAAA